MHSVWVLIKEMLGTHSQLVVYYTSSVDLILDSRYIIHYDMPKSFEGALVMPTISYAIT